MPNTMTFLFLFVFLHLSLALAGGVSAETVAIEAGTFLQGSDRAPDERPIREIRLSAFQLDKSVVTVAQFEAFVVATNADSKSVDLRRSGRPTDHPVVAVTWAEADAFCRWRGGALPTEAQWERAACGAEGGAYPWGQGVRPGVAWSEKIDPNALMTVNTMPAAEDANARRGGLNHMAGNVWEWTADWYHRDAYRSAVVVDPNGPDSGRWRVIRGGSFANLPSYCTCSHREPALPTQPRLTTGFRCAYPSD
jgi:formylglycine-generating enzyme required for sulfatase activity